VKMKREQKRENDRFEKTEEKSNFLNKIEMLEICSATRAEVSLQHILKVKNVTMSV
jgi:hypothetical protein